MLKVRGGFEWGMGAGAKRALGAGIALGLVAGTVSATGANQDRELTYGAAKGKPLLAVVSLGDQRITVYGAGGKIVEAPVSSGRTEYETPAGIFSIVQKKEHHQSNLYQDGEMPFMQRLTWTGIALHAGALPGHPASHGCVRLPMSFARDLFDMTEMGMRVVIVRDDMRPSDFSHPLLFRSKPVPKDLGRDLGPSVAPGVGSRPQRRAQLGTPALDGEIAPGSARHVRILQSIAEAREADLEAANRQQRELRTAAARAAAEVAAATRAVRAAESTVATAESALSAVDKQIEKATSPEAKQRAETAKEKMVARVDELKARLDAVKAQEDAKRSAADRAAQEAQAAVAAKDLAAQAAEDASRSISPVSVFVSRKMQRLYVRRGTHPVFEAPVAISNADRPIGTFVFTALDQIGTAGEMRWNVVSMYKNPLNIEPASKERRAKGRGTAPAAPTDVAAAKAALDRITIEPAVLDIIAGQAVLPGSSLIVSDEGPSRETGKDTDFVVVMAGEPQGALKVRQREPLATPKDAFDDPWGKSPWGGSSKGSPFFWKW